MLDLFQLGSWLAGHRERSAGHTESAVGGEIAAMLGRPKLGRHAAVWGGFNKINKLTGRPPPAPEARGGQSLTKDQFVIALPPLWVCRVSVPLALLRGACVHG